MIESILASNPMAVIIVLSCITAALAFVGGMMLMRYSVPDDLTRRQKIFGYSVATICTIVGLTALVGVYFLLVALATDQGATPLEGGSAIIPIVVIVIMLGTVGTGVGINFPKRATE